jgi:hypothetical protein
MTRYPLARVASALVGVLLSVGAGGAQSSDRALIWDAVSPPSSEFRTYVEGELVRVSVPARTPSRSRLRVPTGTPA